MSHSSGSGINMSKLIEPLSGFLRKKEATTWTSIRIHHCPPPTKFSRKKRNFSMKKREKIANGKQPLGSVSAHTCNLSIFVRQRNF